HLSLGRDIGFLLSAGDGHVTLPPCASSDPFPYNVLLRERVDPDGGSSGGRGAVTAPNLGYMPLPAPIPGPNELVVCDDSGSLKNVGPDPGGVCYTRPVAGVGELSLHPDRLIDRVPVPGCLPGLELVNQRRERLRFALVVRLRRYELRLRHNPAFEAGVDEAPQILQTAYGSRYVSREQFTWLIHGLSIPPIVQLVKCISRPASETSSPSSGRDGMLPEPFWRGARS